MTEMTERPDVALWRITLWEPPNKNTQYPGSRGPSGYRIGGTNRTAEVVSRTLESAVAAIREAYPDAHIMSVNKVSKTGLFLVVNDD